MKKINLIKKTPQLAAFAFVIFSGPSFADVCKMMPGSVRCGGGSVDSLHVNGKASLKGTTVLGHALINGLLIADESVFNAMQVNGSADVTHCSFNQTPSINGTLKASSSAFNESLDVHSSMTRLINTVVKGDIHVYHTSPANQVVYLDGLSRVSGNVVFDDEEGEVILRGGSRVEGRVVGGQVVSK